MRFVILYNVSVAQNHLLPKFNHPDLARDPGANQTHHYKI